MSFWIKVDVCQSGEVTATTYNEDSTGGPKNSIRFHTGSTVSQALWALASSMVTIKAETVGQKERK